MSASMRPTRWPRRESATARLTATVVLPTPPLPEPMATILETPGRATGEGMAGECAIYLIAPLKDPVQRELCCSRLCFDGCRVFLGGSGQFRLFAAGGLGFAVLAAAHRILITADFIGRLWEQNGDLLAMTLFIDGHKDQVGAGHVR